MHIDTSSGGYPFFTINFKQVHLFNTKEHAIEYMNMFPRRVLTENWAIQKIEIKFTEC